MEGAGDELEVPGEEVEVLLEEDDVNHHLVHGRANYHIFAMQISHDHPSTIYVEVYYPVVEYLGAYPLEVVDQL